MTVTTEQIRGIPLSEKPKDICRCGMSMAKFAQHRATSQWYKLSKQGKVIGSSIDLDYFRPQGGGAKPKATRQAKDRKLAGV